MTADFPVPDATEPEDHGDSASARLREVAGALGMRLERLQILDEGVGRLEFLGTEAWFYKVYDPESDTSSALAVDSSGKVVDPVELSAADERARRERYGSLQPALDDLLDDQADRDRRIPVMIRYVVEEGPGIDKREIGDSRPDDERVAALADSARDNVAEVARRAEGLHRALLRELGDEESDDQLPTSGPFVRAVLSSDSIRALGRDERVAFVGMDREKEIPDYPTIPQSLPTTRTDTVHGTGVRGDGIRIAVLESGALTVNAACFHIGATQSTNQSGNDHMTKSVAIIGNRYQNGQCGGPWEGYAPDATVLLANETNYQDRYDWARDQGVNVVTMSWHAGSEETSGALSSRDIYFDYWVKQWPYPSVFTSAGNQASSSAFASGKGYNFCGVGNVLNDGDGNRSNDVIDSTSSWKNPTSTHGDHEVPALAAPGSRHDVIGSSFGGTSCATPVTASIAALLMSSNTALRIWPEAIRAILMATANYQNADAADYSRFADGKDGTGMVNTLYGRWTADRREPTSAPQFRAHDYGLISAADFANGYYTRTWTAHTGTTRSRIRVALAWNSRTTTIFGIPISSVLDADLDLHVFDSNGALVAAGSSWDNSWEFVEFTPSKVGDYTIKIRGFSVPQDFSSWFGVAWTTHYDL